MNVKTACCLSILLWLTIGSAWAQTLRVRNNPFEGKTQMRPEGLYAELNPLATALGVKVERAGEGRWVGPPEVQDLAPVPAGQVHVGAKFLPCLEGEQGELMVPAEAVCEALGGMVRRHAGGREINLTFDPSVARPPDLGVGQAVKGADFSVGSGPVRRDDPASYFFTQVRSSSNPGASRHNGNCGPTCLAMAALVFDRFPLGINPSDRQGLVRWCRTAMTGASDDLRGTSGRELEKAAQELKLNPKRIRRLEDLDLEFRQGRMAIVAGNPSDLGFRNTSGKGHWILVVGKSGEDYIVNDPGLWYRLPGARIRAAKMKAFFRYAIGLGDR